MLTKIYSSKRDDGFTLIELLVVVIIIGVLAAIALPIFIDQSKQAVDASVKSDVRNTVSNVNGWRASNLGLLPNSAEAYAATGGKLATSKDAYVNVAFTSDGNYTVCGYNPGGAKYADHSHAWLFDSSTGKFNAATTADCTNAVHQRGNVNDTSGDGAKSDEVVTFPLGSTSGGTGGTGTGDTGAGTGGAGTGGTGTGSTAGSSTVIAYDPEGTKTVTPGDGGNSGIPGTLGGPAGSGTNSIPTPTGSATSTTGTPSTTPSGTPTGGSSSPTTGDPGTTPNTTPSTTPSTPTTTPVLASPGGTTLTPYAVGGGNPSCSYATAPSIYSTFIDANCHKVHVTSVRTVSAFGNPEFGFVYNFDHDSACQADGVAAGKAESANTDSQGRPCDWLLLGANGQNTSVNAAYEQYYFDYGTYPASWIGSNSNPTSYPCAKPVYSTNWQKYAFAVCQKDHGWAYDQADLNLG